jgi:hypothetical protein
MLRCGSAIASLRKRTHSTLRADARHSAPLGKREVMQSLGNKHAMSLMGGKRTLVDTVQWLEIDSWPQERRGRFDTAV